VRQERHIKNFTGISPLIFGEGNEILWVRGRALLVKIEKNSLCRPKKAEAVLGLKLFVSEK